MIYLRVFFATTNARRYGTPISILQAAILKLFHFNSYYVTFMMPLMSYQSLNWHHPLIVMVVTWALVNTTF